MNARNPDQHMFQSVVTRYGSYPLCGETALLLSSRSELPSVFPEPRSSVTSCNRISTSRVCRTEREPATLATPPKWRSIRAKARDLHEIHALRSTRSFGWRPTPLASTGLWPPGWQVRLETVSSRADGRQLGASGAWPGTSPVLGCRGTRRS